jgi:hypothetical protein
MEADDFKPVLDRVYDEADPGRDSRSDQSSRGSNCWAAAEIQGRGSGRRHERAHGSPFGCTSAARAEFADAGVKRHEETPIHDSETDDRRRSVGDRLRRGQVLAREG